MALRKPWVETRIIVKVNDEYQTDVLLLNTDFIESITEVDSAEEQTLGMVTSLLFADGAAIKSTDSFDYFKDALSEGEKEGA